MKKFFKHYRFFGTYWEVGYQHGTTLKDEIQGHLALILQLAQRESNVNREEALKLTMDYEPYIEKYAPGFLEELKGLAEGANIMLEEALLMQMKMEVIYSAKFGAEEPYAAECTAFAFNKSYTCDSKVYCGQNTDQSGNFADIANIVTFAVEGKPEVMMVAPAGQISFVGMNNCGLGVSCNFLPCTGWKVGFPRYLLSRLLLEQTTFEEACAKLESIAELAAARNLLIVDENGNMVDYEVLPVETGKIEGSGMLIHANHFLHHNMLQYEKSDMYELEDSMVRQKRFEELGNMNKGRIDLEKVKSFLRDHGNHACYSICMHPSLHNTYHTMASMIFDLCEHKMHVAVGNPCETEYYEYEF